MLGRALLLMVVAVSSLACAPKRLASPDEVVFEGACDASGAVALSSRLFLLADDEDNVLRVYDAERGGPPLRSIDLSPSLGLLPKGKRHPKAPEADLEAAARVGDRAYWLTSHGRNSKGKLKAERLLFFATTAPSDGGDVRLVGRPYEGLMGDLLGDSALSSFDLAHAATLAPKAPGGLNIEGLTARPDGTLLLAFRNPVPQGRALLVPLLNAAEIVESPKALATLGPPVLLDLAGLGVRSLSWWRERYLILAGPTDHGGASRLYTWRGEGAAMAEPLDLADYNPEGFFSPEGRDRILLLSDDGSRLVDGTACKDLEDTRAKRFRGLWVSLPPT